MKPEITPQMDDAASKAKTRRLRYFQLIWFCKDNCVNGFFVSVFVVLFPRGFATR
jgi:hypothetical protein